MEDLEEMPGVETEKQLGSSDYRRISSPLRLASFPSLNNLVLYPLISSIKSHIVIYTPSICHSPHDAGQGEGCMGVEGNPST